MYFTRIGEYGMRSVEVIGKNVDEAIEKALLELDAEKEQVDIEILDQGSKGFLNIIGNKPAKVKVTVKKTYLDKAKEFLADIFTKMNLEAEINITEKDDVIRINVSGSNMGTIIGYRGETLDALQYLVSLVINKEDEEYHKRVIMDTENYRHKREETLKKVAEKSANKVISSGRIYKLEPMNPYERRIIHAALQESTEVYTYSEGKEPYRRIVIDLKK